MNKENANFLMLMFASIISINSLFANDTTLLKSQRMLFNKVYERFVDTSFFKNNLNTNTRFKHISIIDLRQDSACIGSYSIGTDNFAIIKLENQYSLQQLLTKNLKRCDNKNDTNLVILVNKFWIRDSIGKNRLIDNSENVLALILKVDCFFETINGIKPFVKIDTSFTYSHKDSHYYFKTRVEGIVSKSIEAMFLLLENAYQEKRYMKLKPVDKTVFQNYLNNLKSIERPILNPSEKGVYANFKELLNNKPSHKMYTIIEDKKIGITYLYVKDSTGEEFLSRNSWGVYDGNNLWVNNKGNLALLNKFGDDYYWFESSEVKVRNENNSFNVPIPVRSSADIPYFPIPIKGEISNKKTLLKLDTKTGKSF